MSAWRHLSLWMNQLDDPLEARPSLEESLEVDVAIVGAGYTGLWTAYYLKRRAPQLRVAIVEAETAGFGASGRNGGWLMGNLLGEDGLLAGLPPERRRAGYDLLHGIPDEVARVLQEEGIDCDYRKGGVLYCAARYPEQERRLRAYLHDLYAEGLDESDYRWLTPQELDQQLRIPGSYGAIHSPHCATIQPARLARGLARAVERLGVRLFEKSRVLHWQRGLLRTERGELRAEWIVPAVEGYAASLPPLGHYQLPVQSLLVATEPLPSSVWAEIGLSAARPSANSAARSPTASAPPTTAWPSARGAATASAASCATTSASTTRKSACVATCSANSSRSSRTPGSATPGAATSAWPGASARTCCSTAPVASPSPAATAAKGSAPATSAAAPGRADPRRGQRAAAAALGAGRASTGQPGPLGTGTLPLARLQRDHPQFRP